MSYILTFKSLGSVINNIFIMQAHITLIKSAIYCIYYRHL